MVTYDELIDGIETLERRGYEADHIYVNREARNILESSASFGIETHKPSTLRMAGCIVEVAPWMDRNWSRDVPMATIIDTDQPWYVADNTVVVVHDPTSISSSTA